MLRQVIGAVGTGRSLPPESDRRRPRPSRQEYLIAGRLGAFGRHWRAVRQGAREQRERLRSHPLFAACSNAQLKTLLRWGDEVAVPGGVDLLRENALGTCLVAVLSGRLRVTKRGRQLGTVERGGWVGDVAILGLGPQPATVTTAGDSVLFALSPRAVVSFAVTFSGLRQGLFPGKSEAEAHEQVRHMRQEGLAQWRRLRSPVPTAPVSRPAWLRAYPSRSLSSVSARMTMRPFQRQPTAPQPNAQRRPVGAWVALVGAAGCLGAFVVLPIPYYSLHGAVRSATDSVHVSGVPTYPPHGQVEFPIVITHRCTPFGATRDWLEGVEVRAREEVFGSASPQTADHINLELMGSSKHSAVAAVTAFLGGRVGADRVRIDSGQVGGPSGGLAFTLALIDDLTPGELTGGHMVAATGTMAADGAVGRVGGVRLKALAARAAGVELFLVPAENYREAQANAGPMRVVAVHDLRSALDALATLRRGA